MKKWYKLDNTGKLYSAVTKKGNTCVFRIAAILTENIDPYALREAAERTIKRFPTVAVKLRKGLFWAYLYENKNPLIVHEEVDYPCAPIMGRNENNEYLFRIMYFGHRITLECFHALADGKGAMEFLKALSYQYLLAVGKDVEDEGMILLPESAPSPEEEDGYARYYQKGVNKTILDTKKARAIQGTVYKGHKTKVIHGVISASQLNDYARHNEVTITGYLAAVLAQAIFDSASQQEQCDHPIRISVPVNLRGMFPSKTLRNFISQVSVDVPSAPEKPFNDMVRSISTQMKSSITQEYFSSIMATYVGYEKMLASRVIPWIFKKAIINFVSKQSEGVTTSVLTNLGNIKLPKSMEKYVSMIEAVPPHKQSASINCGVCSVSDKLNIAFSNNTEESDVIDRFFELILSQTGLEIEVYSNCNYNKSAEQEDMQECYPAYTTAKHEQRMQSTHIQSNFASFLHQWKAIIHI